MAINQGAHASKATASTGMMLKCLQKGRSGLPAFCYCLK
jgi:hypothetical protein